MTEESKPYEAVIADLEAKRDQINATIDMLRALSGAGITVISGSVSPQRSDEHAIKRDSFFGMTLPEAARKYLAMMKVTKPNPELCDALLLGGFKTSSSNFPEVVRSTLQRNKDFVKVSGEWGLAEWYSGRGGAKKTRRNIAEEAAPEVVDEGKDEESPAV